MPKTIADLTVAVPEPDASAGPDAPDAASQAEMTAAMHTAAADAAKLLRTIGSPRRLMILCLLQERACTVTEICSAIGMRQSLASQHLTRLRRDGLVTVDRRGHFAYYSIADTVAREIVDTLYRHYCANGAVPRER